MRRVLLRASSREDAVHHGIISFVAGKLIDQLLPLLQWNDRRPWLRPRRRVVERDLVVDRVGSDTRQALNQMEVFGRSHEVAVR